MTIAASECSPMRRSCRSTWASGGPASTSIAPCGVSSRIPSPCPTSRNETRSPAGGDHVGGGCSAHQPSETSGTSATAVTIDRAAAVGRHQPQRRRRPRRAAATRDDERSRRRLRVRQRRDRAAPRTRSRLPPRRRSTTAPRPRAGSPARGSRPRARSRAGSASPARRARSPGRSRAGSCRTAATGSAP